MRRFLFAALAAIALVCPAQAEDREIYFFLPSVAVTVGTSATRLDANTEHSFIEVCNDDASKTLRLSFSATMTTGRPLLAGDCIRFVGLVRGQKLYGLTSSGTLSAIVTEALPSGR
jgi:hypothetical protein